MRKPLSVKKLICLILVSAMVISFTGCGIVDNDPDDEDAEENMITVGIVNSFPGESGYRQANENNLRDTFTEDNGYIAFFAYSEDNDQQILSARKFIDNGVDYLLISADETYGWTDTLQMAQKAGTKVILFDRTIDITDPYYVTSIVCDYYQEGETAVGWLKSQGLDHYSILDIEGVQGTTLQTGRGGALYKACVKNDNWSIVASTYADLEEEKAYDFVVEEIKKGTEFNIIYAQNDVMARGAVRALDEAGISHGVDGDVIIVSFECNKFALEELLKGNWNYDGQCNPYLASYMDDIIKRMEAGEEITEKKMIMEETAFDATTIRKKDVEKYGI